MFAASPPPQSSFNTLQAQKLSASKLISLFAASLPLYSNLSSPQSQKPSASELISYKWSSGNSCFFDVGLAIWFEAYRRCPPPIRRSFPTLLPMDSVLSSIFYHYERPIKWLATDRKELSVGRRELSLGQELARHGIFDRLKLYEHGGAYGCSRTWMFRVVNVS
jgi:hypothetical protein